jgi:hypothetical protein
MSPLLKQGSGWRVGWNPKAPKFKALIGNDDWAIELTAAELEDLQRLADQLHRTLQQTAQELMPEEQITCEAESDLLWLAFEGYPDAYCLRLILNSVDRSAEAYWPASVVPELLQAIQALTVF